MTFTPGLTLDLWRPAGGDGEPAKLSPSRIRKEINGSLLEQLNPYSRKVAEALFETLPELAGHAQVDHSPGAMEGTLLIRMAQPHETNEPGLYIATDIREITVGFRACYVYFTDNEQAGAEEHIARAVTHVRDLIEDRIVIKKWFRSGVLCGSSLDTPNELPSPSRNGITTVQMISWSGRSDRTVLIPAAY
jgi:hypothetical protein